MIPQSELVYSFGDTVWHKTNGDEPGIVTGYIYRQSGLLFEVCWQGRVVDTHHACELTTDRPKYSAQEPEDSLP